MMANPGELMVTIKGFQSILDAVLRLVPGVNIIVGNNNEGKSALIRAIDCALFNRPGDSYINTDSKRTEVGIAYQKNSYRWSKQKSGSKAVASAEFNGETLEKLGREPIEAVLKSFKINITDLSQSFRVKLNFQGEDELPFLSEISSAELFSFLGMSSEAERLDVVLKKLNTDLRELDGEVTQSTAVIDVIRQDMSGNKEKHALILPLLPDIRAVENYEANVDFLRELGRMTGEVESLTERIDGLKKEAEEVREVCKPCVEVMKSSETLIKECAGLDKTLNSLDAVERRISDQRLQQNSLINKIKVYQEIADIMEKSVIPAQEEVTGLRSLVNQLKQADTKMAEATHLKKQLSDGVKGMTEALEIVDTSVSSTNIIITGLSSLVKTLERQESDLEKATLTKKDISQKIAKVEKDLKSFNACPLCERPF